MNEFDVHIKLKNIGQLRFSRHLKIVLKLWMGLAHEKFKFVLSLYSELGELAVGQILAGKW